MEIYAELSRKQYNAIKTGEVEIQVPDGVSMTNKANSKALFFECEDEETSELLCEGLDNSFISWQKND